MCQVAANNNSRDRDQTQTAGLRRKARAAIRKRLNSAYKELRDYIHDLPRERVTIQTGDFQGNAGTRVYQYDLTNRDTDAFISDLVHRWFDMGEMPNRWFMSPWVKEASDSGASQEITRVRRMADLAGAPAEELSRLDVEAILQSPAYRKRIDKVYRRVFEEMRSFEGETATDLARTLGSGVAEGKGVRDITRDIKSQFGVAESRAERITRTELGKSYRDARNDQTRQARRDLGMDVRTQWISVLAATSRRSHMLRHLKIYTPEQNAEFYSSPESDGGQINCLCIQQSVIIKSDGKVVGARKPNKWEKKSLAARGIEVPGVAA